MTKMVVFLLCLLTLLLLPLLAPTNAHAQVAKETALMTKELPDLPGKEGLVETAYSLRARSFRRIAITQMPLRVTQPVTLLVSL